MENILDFTYIDDVINSLKEIIKKGILKKYIKKNKNRHQIYNIGNNNPLKLKDLIKFLEYFTKVKSKKKYLSLQTGDVVDTRSDSRKLLKDFKFRFQTKPKNGLEKFIDWYKKYYNVS